MLWAARVACGPSPYRTGPPYRAHPIHEFFKASGNLLRGSRKTAGRKVLVNFPSGHAMSSRQVFLSGLLQQSPPPLRRPHHLANPKCSALPTTRIANPGTAKPLARAPSYWHNGRRTRAGFPTLESPDRCPKDRVHLSPDRSVLGHFTCDQ